MDYKEFSSKIKSKYPEYASVDDSILVKKIIDKYPEYKEIVEFDTKPKIETTFKQKFTPIEKGLGGFIKGASLGLSSKLIPLGQTLTEYPSGQTPPPFKSVYKQKEKEYEGVQKQLEGIPYTIGQIASYLTPGTAPKAVFKGVSKGMQFATKNADKADPIAKYLMGNKVLQSSYGTGAASGLENIVETGNPKQAATKALQDAVLTMGMGGIASPILSGVRKTGEKLVKSNILSKSQNLPRDIENLKKHELTKNINNSLENIDKKATQKLNQYEDQLDKVLKGNENNLINLNESIEKIRTEVLQDPHFSGMGEKAINSILDQAKNNASRFGTKGVVTPDLANEFKRGLKPKTKFQPTNSAQNYQKELWNKIYLTVRDKISETVPESKALNQAESEIIPIKDALEKLITANEKKGPIGLSDIILGTGAGLGALNPVLQSFKQGDVFEGALRSTIPLAAIGIKKGLSSPQGAIMFSNAPQNLSPEVAKSILTSGSLLGELPLKKETEQNIEKINMALQPLKSYIPKKKVKQETYDPNIEALKRYLQGGK